MTAIMEIQTNPGSLMKHMGNPKVMKAVMALQKM
jgi:hypothetical protein